jgi:glycosyltransferase involved in cell wall biosynthesis
MNDTRLTLSMPCFGRRKGTIRAIECIANQSIDGWEALVIGDGCPIMQDFVDSDYFSDIINDCNKRGNSLIIKNNDINYGGHGYHITNQNIQAATGKYFLFFANDDVILPNHFANYLSQIEGTDFDFVYFDSWVNPIKHKRVSRLQYGMIGHSELIIKTDFLKKMPTHNEHYGHDWALIQSMANTGKSKKASTQETTYHVMSLSDNREAGID